MVIPALHSAQSNSLSSTNPTATKKKRGGCLFHKLVGAAPGEEDRLDLNLESLELGTIIEKELREHEFHV